VVEDLAHEHGRQAALLLTYIKQVFAWAEDREVIEANPVATLKAQKVAPELAPRKRARVLSDDEIRGLWNLTEPPDGMHRTTLLVLQLILATGQRPGEVAGMRWSEFDDETWIVPAERRRKTDDEHAVPLTRIALELLERAQSLARPDADYVFERQPGKPVSVAAIGKAVNRCAKALGNAEGDRWRPHDLRRTMRTGLAAAGISETVAEVTIGHVRRGIAGVYDRHGYEAEKVAALQAWERRLLRIAAGKPADDNRNVVSIAEGRE
jgi:integrase